MTTNCNKTLPPPLILVLPSTIVATVKKLCTMKRIWRIPAVKSWRYIHGNQEVSAAHCSTCQEITTQHILVEYSTNSTVHGRRLQHSTLQQSTIQIVQYMIGDYSTAHDSRVQYKQYCTCQEIKTHHMIVEYSTNSTLHARRLQHST